MSNPSNDLVSPWEPITEPRDLKAIGKLGEESCELGAALFRCVIQGVDESEPNTGKVNRRWVEEELGDVDANKEFLIEYLGLDREFIKARSLRKRANLERWHAMLPVKKEA